MERAEKSDVPDIDKKKYVSFFLEILDFIAYCLGICMHVLNDFM